MVIEYLGENMIIEDARARPKEVEAIENGKIVKVSEDYAKREGLLVLRKESKFDRSEESGEEGRKSIMTSHDHDENKLLSFDDFRKPLKMKNNQVYRELIDNFHWDIKKARRDKGLMRKKVAKDLGIDEADLKLIENGIYPDKDFVLINKIQKYFGLNLRKDKKDDLVFDQNMRKLAEDTKKGKFPENNEWKRRW